MDPYREYLIEAIGVDSRDLLGEDTHPGDLTLEDPRIIAIWNARGTSRLIIKASPQKSISGFFSAVHGTRQIEIAAGDGGTGTYRIKVRVNNVCRAGDRKVEYPWFSGPNCYNKLDRPADTSEEPILRAATAPNEFVLGSFLEDNWTRNPPRTGGESNSSRDTTIG